MFSTFQFFLTGAVFSFGATFILLWTVSPGNIELSDLSEQQIAACWWAFHLCLLIMMFNAFVTILLGVKAILDKLKELKEK
jgi:hypothetical protein